MTDDSSQLLTRDPTNAKLQRLWAEAQAVRPDVLMHMAFVNTYAVDALVEVLAESRQRAA